MRRILLIFISLVFPFYFCSDIEAGTPKKTSKYVLEKDDGDGEVSYLPEIESELSQYGKLMIENFLKKYEAADFRPKRHTFECYIYRKDSSTINVKIMETDGIKHHSPRKGLTLGYKEIDGCLFQFIIQDEPSKISYYPLVQPLKLSQEKKKFVWHIKFLDGEYPSWYYELRNGEVKFIKTEKSVW